MTSTNKRLIIIGGGTFSHIRAHLSLAVPAFGETAKTLYKMCTHSNINMDIELVLTKMADSNSNIITNDDLDCYIEQLLLDNTVKCIIFNAGVCDFVGNIDNIPSSKNADRLLSRNKSQVIELTPTEKIITKIRKHRKDIFVVGFKSTTNATKEEQFSRGLSLLKSGSINLVISNDLNTREHMIITPEEGAYDYGKDRKQCLLDMVDMVTHRTHLSFTRSTVIAGTPIPWSPESIYPNLCGVIDWCIANNAYKPFNGVTTGHFAAKISDTEFITSIRKTNFNNIKDNGMVLVKTDGPDNVIAYGSKPSVGGQSQRIIFNKFQSLDCIVHFHCPIKVDAIDTIPTVSQFEYECGSHECGENTANGLLEVRPGIFVVMLENHGPNIVFNHSTPASKIIEFINDNFDLNKSSSGFERVYFN